MTPFAYSAAADVKDALRLLCAGKRAKFIAGGTNLVDLMREEIERPDVVVDVRGLPTAGVVAERDGGIAIGAAATHTAVATDPHVRGRYPLVAQAILCGASAQIRNMATIGGNLLQRTRCCYFYDRAARCNKRAPGAGCDALDGFNRYHAVLGASDACIATHPSDVCVAFAALDAVVEVEGPQGRRAIPFDEFHRLPGDTPHIETELRPDELVIAVRVPGLTCARRSLYRKVRDRSSYAFALVSVAAALEVRDGAIADVRLALGGVAHKPWRARRAEEMLQGAPATHAVFAAAATAELAGAKPYRHNAFKIVIAERLITAALDDLATEAPR